MTSWKKIIRGAALAAGLLLSPQAGATTILALPVTVSAGPLTSTPLKSSRGRPIGLSVQCNFTYGSGGTSADAWVQTSIDGGVTWTDIANCHFLVASARFIYNLSALTPKTTEVVPTDGTLAANTAVDGVVGTLFRVKYVIVGTYAGGTVMNVDIQTDLVGLSP